MSSRCLRTATALIPRESAKSLAVMGPNLSNSRARRSLPTVLNSITLVLPISLQYATLGDT